MTIPNGDTGEIQLWATPTCEAGGAGKELLETDDDLHAGFHHLEEVASTQAVGTAITATLVAGRRGPAGRAVTWTFSTCTMTEPSK